MYSIQFRMQLTFKDINELVEQNVQLRSLVRSLYEQFENQKVEFKVGWERFIFYFFSHYNVTEHKGA